ncbi:hypothetical protein H0G86_003097 [Trichoderma simmonsii]|uniref:Uncharacterized protein n=1 Tax=Trichoderma simmonsii TaxID=1491479 RepID=A0A8G0L9K7_9HYPO|nr:hypothetical protein H0G86_003097 [Trichoderma simmonsii]
MTLFLPSLSPTMPFPMGIILRRSPKKRIKKNRGGPSYANALIQDSQGIVFVPMRRSLLVILMPSPSQYRSSHLKKPNKRMDGIAARHRVQGGARQSNLISTEHLC